MSVVESASDSLKVEESTPARASEAERCSSAFSSVRAVMVSESFRKAALWAVTRLQRVVRVSLDGECQSGAPITSVFGVLLYSGQS